MFGCRIAHTAGPTSRRVNEAGPNWYLVVVGRQYSGTAQLWMNQMTARASSAA
jgi:hypothetical protein